MHFDWKRPNNLIQSDLMEFNNIPILTMEDDHSRHSWSQVIENESAETVAAAMRALIPYKFNNLLTDNGPQFSKKNLSVQTYLKDHVLKNHIHASIHHPQTLGKISAYQKGLKHFLRYKLGDSCNRILVKVILKAYNLFYNNGRYHTGAKGIPNEIYSGKRDKNWFGKMMKMLKSENYKPFFVSG
jgi:transposase InsO family protein